MRKNYMSTFISLCKKLSVYVTQHEHIMLGALAETKYASDEEKQQVRELFKQLKDMSVIFHKLDNKFGVEEVRRQKWQERNSADSDQKD